MTPERRKRAVREAQQTSIARQRLAKHVFVATDKHIIIEEMLAVVISIRSFQKL
jgi:hypothetical protein